MTDFAHFPRPGENYPYEKCSVVQCSLDSFRVLSLNFGGKWRRRKNGGDRSPRSLTFRMYVGVVPFIIIVQPYFACLLYLPMSVIRINLLHRFVIHVIHKFTNLTLPYNSNLWEKYICDILVWSPYDTPSAPILPPATQATLFSRHVLASKKNKNVKQMINISRGTTEAETYSVYSPITQ